MPIDFPASPTNGQTVSVAGRTWTYDGTVWKLTTYGIAGGPIGSIFLWAGTATGGSAPAYSSLPSGHLLCDGSNVSRTTYSALFDVISTRYGVGNGSTTFTLPNLLARIPRGLATAATNPTVPNTVVSGIQSANHSHTITSNSGVESATHAHGFQVYYNGGNLESKTTGNDNADHTHTITSNAGNQSADHTHSLDTVDVHYIIRAT